MSETQSPAPNGTSGGLPPLPVDVKADLVKLLELINSNQLSAIALVCVKRDGHRGTILSTNLHTNPHVSFGLTIMQLQIANHSAQAERLSPPPPQE